MGDGRILRDFLYVDDLVDVLVLAASSEKAYGQLFNVGTGIPVDFRTLGDTIVRLAGSGRCEFVPFSEERKQLEPGHYYADIGKIKNLLGWQPKISLDEGLQRTLEYYHNYREYYWKPDHA
jgi:nucleoside-diphosphate-sugar epimerase